MSKWVTEQLTELLDQINEVPYTDERDKRQLSILMNGFAKLNNKAMDKAATKTKAQMRGWSLEEATAEQPKPIKKTVKRDDSAADELTRLRPIR